jgi:hypothetical protein
MISKSWTSVIVMFLFAIGLLIIFGLKAGENKITHH